jgi:hypothetical protein
MLSYFHVSDVNVLPGRLPGQPLVNPETRKSQPRITKGNLSAPSEVWMLKNRGLRTIFSFHDRDPFRRRMRFISVMASGFWKEVTWLAGTIFSESAPSRCGTRVGHYAVAAFLKQKRTLDSGS